MTQSTETKNTEEKILRAAEREFLDKGYGGARTTAIASAAGVTHAMLHYYFRTKENLFQRIINEKVSHLRGLMLGPLLDRDMPLMDKIKFAIENHLDFLGENPDLPRFMLSIMTSYPEWMNYFEENVAPTQANMLTMLQAELDRNAEAGVCRPTDAKMLLLDVVSLNVFSFIGAPLINAMMGGVYSDPTFIAQRKKNNVELIMQKLKP